MKDGDVLMYSDAGATVDPNIDQYIEMINKVSTTPSGIVSWELPYVEKTWTKMDLISYLQGESLLENK